jgi:LPXTG-motif cell wall-anchored protein
MTRTRLTSTLVAGLLAAASVVLTAPAASAEDGPVPSTETAASEQAPADPAAPDAVDEGVPADAGEQGTAQDSTAPAGSGEEPAAPEAAAAAVPASISPAVSFTISPSGPWTGGQKVTVTTTGWAPGDSYTIFTCPTGVYPAANPPGAGCAAFTGPHGFFGVVDGSGKGTATITILQGSVDGITCEKDGDCTIGVYGIDAEATPENTPAAKPITYVVAEDPTTPDTETPDTETPSTGGDTDTDTESGPQLAETGAGQAAPYAAWAGIALLAGTGLLLASRRRAEIPLDE